MASGESSSGWWKWPWPRRSYSLILGFPDGSVGKESACNTGDTGDVGLIPGQEDPLEKEMATHSSILAWKIPWTGAWWTVVHGVTKSWTWISTHTDRLTPLSTTEILRSWNLPSFCLSWCCQHYGCAKGWPGDSKLLSILREEFPYGLYAWPFISLCLDYFYINRKD